MTDEQRRLCSAAMSKLREQANAFIGATPEIPNLGVVVQAWFDPATNTLHALLPAVIEHIWIDVGFIS